MSLHFYGLFTCVAILVFWDFALSYAFACILKMVMFPGNEKIAVWSILGTSYESLFY